MRKTGIFLFLLLSSLLGSSLPDTTQASDSPRELVMQASRQLVMGLREQREAIRADAELAFQLAESSVIPLIDFEGIARTVLGKYWRLANDQQREAFLREFRVFLTNTYVTAMITYADEILSHAESVSYPPTPAEADGDTATVRSLLTLPGGGSAQVDYRMRRTEKGWKAYDLTIEGISLALTYRTDFSAQIQRNGLDSLIARLASENKR